MPPPRNAGAEALGGIAAQVIADNADIADRAKAIVNALLGDVERIIRVGDTAQKAVYVRAILPSLLRATQDASANNDVELKAAFERVMAAVRGG